MRGFTLYEVMIVTAITALVVTALGGMSDSLYRTNRVSREYTRELLDMRRAVRLLEDDLRTGNTVAYRVEGAVLYRGSRVLARHISTFEITRDGGLATVRIGPGTRVMTLKVWRR